MKNRVGAVWLGISHALAAPGHRRGRGRVQHRRQQGQSWTMATSQAGSWYEKDSDKASGEVERVTQKIERERENRAGRRATTTPRTSTCRTAG
jgi:hypothetical protein